MKTTLKAWNDPLTAIEELNKLKKEYIEQGYAVDQLLGVPGFQLKLDDGAVCFYWENGKIIQEITEK